MRARSAFARLRDIQLTSRPDRSGFDPGEKTALIQCSESRRSLWYQARCLDSRPNDKRV